MASVTVTKKLREEATCTICLELMVEPMSINCGHIYGCLCVVGLLDNRSSKTSSLGIFHCPQCQEPFKSDSLRANKQLGSIIEFIKDTGQERLCENYGEWLCLFCEDDRQFICWRCEWTPQHRGHVSALVEDACGDYKDHQK